jgi:hypothetical protein
MKIRSGFVSNSSSSSFVMIGVQLNSEQEDVLKKYVEENTEYENFWDFVYESDDFKLETSGEGDYEGVYGIYLASGSEYEFPATDISFSKLNEYADKVVNELDKFGIMVDEEEVMVYTGTKMC